MGPKFGRLISMSRDLTMKQMALLSCSALSLSMVRSPLVPMGDLAAVGICWCSEMLGTPSSARVGGLDLGWTPARGEMLLRLHQAGPRKALIGGFLPPGI